MAEQIIILKKNWADFEKAAVTATATEDDDLTQNILNRSNLTGWATSASVDASATEIVVDFADVQLVNDILLLKHNFKKYVLSYYDDDTGLYVTLFTTTTNTEASTHYYSATGFHTSKIKIRINGTFVADSNKYLFQFIASERIGQFAGWPVIKKPVISRDLRKSKMLSGKTSMFANTGAFACKLSWTNLSSSADLAIIERMYQSNEGFLVWLCGGDEDQFSSVRQGYRMEDIYLMRCQDEHSPEFYGGFYKSGMKIEVDLVEVVT